VAIYKNNELEEYPLYGLDMIGKLVKDAPQYYYKDHLGSVRAVVNSDNEVLSAQDYDAWGYLLEGRQYESDSSKFKFTGKERDEESDYDYFGARYYDARIGRWNATDPLFEKYVSYSPYSYVLDNPLIFKDPNGKWIAQYDESENKIYVVAEENDKLEDLYNQLGLSEKEFSEKFKIGDISNYKLVSGETNFDITSYVLSNANFSSDPNEMNCFSSCLTGIGFLNEEIIIRNTEGGKGFTQDLISSFGFQEVNELNPAVMKTWVDPENVTNHSAIYIVRSQKGIEYYFGRPGPDTKLSVQTSDRLNQLYPDFKTYLLNYPK